MYQRQFFIVCMIIVGLFRMADGQESVRSIDRPGAFNKYLTPNTVDRWHFDGFENETVIVHVQTREFDSTVQLVQVLSPEKEKVLREIDDEGSNCWLSFRLPADGEYKICVRGCESKGGGNYSLELKQFEAAPLEIGKSLTGRFGRDGQAYFYFTADAEQFATVDARGFATRKWTVLDTQGKPLSAWHRMVSFDKSGEYMVKVEGHSNSPFELTLHPVAIKNWEDGENSQGKLEPRHAEVINIRGSLGAFRLIELETEGTLQAQVIHAPDQADQKKRIGKNRNRPAIVFLPVSSKGPFVRQAMVWGRDDRFQLRIYSERGASYRSIFEDPADVARPGQQSRGNLGVGESKFYRLNVEPGQSIAIHLQASQFDGIARLYDSRGHLVRQDDDGGTTFNSLVQHRSYQRDHMLLAISSYGFGGGGKFQLDLDVQPPAEFKFNRKIEGQLGYRGTDHYRVDAQSGRTLIFHVAGRTSQPQVSLKNSRGVEVARGQAQANSPHAVLAYRPSQAESLTLVISLADGGRFELQGFQAD